MLKKFGLSIITAALLLTSFAGLVYAQSEPPNPPDEPQDGFPFRRQLIRRPWDRISLETLSKTLGLSEGEIRSALRDGQSILELAEEQGISEQELVDALRRQAEARIEHNLEQGKITQEQADELLARLFNSEFPRMDYTYNWNRPVDILAEFLGITSEEVINALDGGQSLEELLESNGKTMEEMQEKIREQVHQALADGKISQEQADAFLERILEGRFLNLAEPLGELRSVENLANFLDMTEDEVLAALQEGQTVEELVEAQGKSVDEFKAFIQELATDRIQQALEEGVITQEQAEEMLEGLETSQFRPFKAIQSFLERNAGGIFGRIRDGIDIWKRELGH